MFYSKSKMYVSFFRKIDEGNGCSCKKFSKTQSKLAFENYTRVLVSEGDCLTPNEIGCNLFDL